jgi:hypothetical protein
MNQTTQSQVDQLLLEQGEYLPLEFLIQEGRLSYADYEAWRNGEMICLEEALFGDPAQVLRQLQEAAHYLQKLGWQSEILCYRQWRSETQQQSLRFSHDSRLNQLFHQHYRKPQDQPQLDMFTDTSDAYLVSGITKALIDGNAEEARHWLERLYESSPDHIHLGDLERLVEALEELQNPVTDIDGERLKLQTILTPLAESLLKKESPNLLLPLWTRLSSSVEDHPYQPSQPERHLSYTASQALNWETVRQAVERESGWQSEPILLLRHARACDHLHLQAAALQSWCQLCWQFPQQVSALEYSTDRELRQLWQAFQELEPELPPITFPAWLLMRSPGMARFAPAPESNDLYPASYQTLYRIKQANSSVSPGLLDQQTLALRAQLKNQDPLLFQHFLGQIDSQ